MRFLLFIIIGFISCKRVGHCSYTGFVFDKSTNQPIQNAKVYIDEDNGGLHPFSSKTAATNKSQYGIDSTRTDSQGKYVIYFRKQIGHDYALVVGHTNYKFGMIYINTKPKKYSHDFYLELK